MLIRTRRPIDTPHAEKAEALLARITAEAADLLYHLSVLLPEAGTSWNEVIAELKRRHASSATASS